ncbi:MULTISPECIES: RagB/SusD family nutrient uptake outer membrane protein [Olivibacter]|uniref:RagB/SusD family nutrient uptake outer membrane protein n=1 Tax=Olivibacter jilunii TaxID=985016 RepID=A0ABW6B6L3_9SPHI|nr:RagB/SusD family nutrient uptake outer membrane protein [Pseudosphingobacterium sp.]
MKKISVLLLIACVSNFFSCKKYLDKVPDKRLVIPHTLNDLQGLLDDYNNMILTIGEGEVSADDYYLTSNDWRSLADEGLRRMYVWEKDYLFSSSANAWLFAYRIVYWSNVVLENIENIDRNHNNTNEWDDLKGQALFMRGKTFLDIATVWAQAYDMEDANNEPGIPLRLNADFNIPSTRAGLADTYQQIIKDLSEAALLLKDSSVHPVRPSRAAAYGMLARAYLYMRDYTNCLHYSELSLRLKNDLMDYNELQGDALFPIKEFNKEVIFASYMAAPQALNINRAKIDSNLYSSYAADDLRRKIFFRDNGDGTVGFRGSYFGGLALFSGLSVNELYLQLAECLIRQGDVNGGLSYLNVLLKTRWKVEDGTSLYKFKTASSASEALDIVLTERRKELLMRGLRWADIKRLNKDDRNIGIRRKVEGKIYELPPNDLRYALPIPEDVIDRTGMPQNPR